VIRTLSLGAGVQSTAIYLLACEGVLPRFDAAIFADTGWEPRAVYDHLDRLEVAGGIPVYRVSSGNIRNDALDPEHRFASMPLYVKAPDVPCTQCVGSKVTWLADTDLPDEPSNRLEKPRKCPRCRGTGREPDGMARRQCTSEYKLKPIKAKVRELLGYPHPTPVPRGLSAEVAIGISTDEIGRVRDSDVKYMRNVFPLLDLGWSRKDCERYLKANGWAVAKSACIGCPFHGNRQWRQLRDDSPEEFADAVDFDASIRAGSARATARGQNLRGSMFLHRSRVPLGEAPIDRVTAGEWKSRQGDLFDQDEDGDPDGCSPFTCRSGEPVTTTDDTAAAAEVPATTAQTPNPSERN
jgi:hypothetical protein